MCEGYNKILKEGKHYLTAVFTYAYKGWESDGDGVILMLDGDIYYCYENPDDGYRSYSVIEKAKSLDEIKCDHQLATFPPQEVYVKFTDKKDELGDPSWECLITNEYNELILKVGTDNYDDYYPMAIFEYHPENLLINKNKR